MLATSEPWPVSVMAKQPGMSRLMMPGQPLGVVFRGAEVHHGRAEQAPLDAGLDLQGRVRDDQFLEPGDVAAVVVRAAQRRGEGAVDGVVVHQVLQLAEGAGAVLGVGQALDLVQFRAAGQRPGVPADVCPLAQQLLAERGDVDGGLRGWLRLGAGPAAGACG